jgi:hypothetical protein
MNAVDTAMVQVAGRMCEPTEPAVLGGTSYPTFRRVDFRWRWFGSRLHTFVFVVELPQASLAQVVAIAEAARAWAREHKGGLPRGFQTGAAAVPVFIVPDVGALRAWAESPQSLQFAAPLFPVVIDVYGRDAAYRTRAQHVGFIYEPFLRGLAAQFIAAAQGARSP